MTIFKVKIGSGDGQILVRQAQGHSREEVFQHFLREGYYVFSVSRSLEPGSLLGLRKRIAAKQFILFNKEFRGLVRAGIPIVEGFDILLKRMKPDRMKTLLEQVREQLTKGESLSEAFQSQGDAIPRYYPALLHAGEQSGGLVEVLDRFIEQEERILRTRKKFWQTLTYPSLLLGVGLICMYIILTRALPEFAGLYQESNRQLPLVTRLVMAISGWLVAYYLHLFLAIGAIGIFLFVYLRTEGGKRMGERVLRRIPIIGKLWSLQNQNIFARTMRMLIAGGIPVPQALSITAGAVPSFVFRTGLGRVHAEVTQGAGFQEALERHVSLSDIAGEMIRVGEATGTLAEMMEYVAEQGEEQSDDYLELVSNLVAPLVLLLVGLIIALLVLAMYIPMFGSYEALGY